jgi:GTPase SAR1 family protein
MDADWLIKHSPQSLSGFVGNVGPIKQLHDYFESNERAVLVIGPSGSGKTTLLSIFLSDYKISNVSRPCYENFTSHKDFESHIINFIETKSLLDMMNKSKPKGLFFDDVDVLLSQDRYVNTFIHDLVKSDRLVKNNVKVVFTCSSSEERKLSELKKKILCVRLENPNPDDAFLYIHNILESEGSEHNENELRRLCLSMHGNIRNVFLNFNFSNTDENQHRYFDLNIFAMCTEIFSNAHKGFEDLEIALSCDPTLISFIMYDNYKTVIGDMYKNIDKSFATSHVPYINTMYIHASLVEDHAYKLNDWSLIENANLLRCGTIRAVQNTIRLGELNICSNPKIGYTQITTRAAQYYNNLKRISLFLDTHRIHRKNQIMLSDVMYEKASKKETLKSCKSNLECCDLGPIGSIYQNNICSPTNIIYAPNITFQIKRLE